MRQNNSIGRLSLIWGLAIVIGCTNTNLSKSNEIKVILPHQGPVELTQDSTFIIFSLEDDTIFVGKKFPPEGYKVEQGTFWPTKTNVSETNVIRESIRSSIDTLRYHDLAANNVWMSLAFYVDSTGIISEAQIRLKRQFEGFFHTNDLINICMSVKGLKYTLPPEYNHLPYVKFSFGYKFK